MTAVAVASGLRVEAAGESLAPGLRERLTRIRVAEGLSLPSQCELVFYGGDGGPSSAGEPGPGDEIRVLDSGSPRQLFQGEVTAVERVFDADGGREVRVRAYDRLHRLRKSQPVRGHRQMSFADLVREVAGEHGLSVDADAEGPVRDDVLQFEQSDWELLRQEGDRSGLYFHLRGDTLRILTLEGAGEAVELSYGETLIEARAEVNADRVCASVAVDAWDPHRATSRREEVDRARSGRRVDARVAADDVGGDGRRHLTDELSREAARATALGQGELDRAEARRVVLEGVADGEVELRPGRPVDVHGLSDALDGRHVLTETCHVVDTESGYTTRFTTTPPEPPPRPRGTAATLGVVVAVDDPEGMGRVKVRLPAYDGLETGWLEVAFVAAGPDRGLTAVPSVEDRVLVLFPRRDPAHGLVLGGLYGEEGPPDDGVEGGEVRRYTLRTPAGQIVELDDGDGSFRLENTGGSRLEVGPDRAVLHAASGLVIEAPGNRISIRGGSIDFSRA